MKARIDFIGSIRALEITIGPNGWHPHLHVLLFTSRDLGSADQSALLEFVRRRWTEAITRRNPDNGQIYRVPDSIHGVTLTESHRDAYIAKLGLADELVMSSTKRGHGADHRTPLQLLEDAEVFRTERDVALWREYAREMHGARQLTWSKGLRQRFAIPDINDDLLSAEPEATGESTLVFTIDPRDWDQFVGPDVELQLRILEAARASPTEYDLADAIVRLLDEAKGLDPVPF
jgi:hypothetical protein